MGQNYLRCLDDGNTNKLADIQRHWCKRSEKIAGADALLTKLQQGYRINKTVICYRVHIRKYRTAKIYHFRLHDSNGNHIDMPVLRNPFVMRLIERLRLKILISKSHKSSKRDIVGEVPGSRQHNSNKRSSAKV